MVGIPNMRETAKDTAHLKGEEHGCQTITRN